MNPSSISHPRPHLYAVCFQRLEMAESLLRLKVLLAPEHVFDHSTRSSHAQYPPYSPPVFVHSVSLMSASTPLKTYAGCSVNSKTAHNIDIYDWHHPGPCVHIPRRWRQAQVHQCWQYSNRLFASTAVILCVCLFVGRTGISSQYRTLCAYTVLSVLTVEKQDQIPP